MRLLLTCSLLLAGAASVHASKASNGGVYELSLNHTASDSVFSVKDTVLYLADKIGVGELYSLGHDSEAIQLIDSMHSSSGPKSKLLVVVKGVDTPLELFASAPSFEVHLAKNGKEASQLVKSVFKKFPKQFARVNENVPVEHLSDEIVVVAPCQAQKRFVHDFRVFNHEIPQRWNAIVESFTGVHKVDESFGELRLRLINDKLFISDLIQMSKLASATQSSSSLVVANLDSLYSIGSRIGYDSVSYGVAKEAMSVAIRALSEAFDVTVIAIGPDHKLAHDKSKMNKRTSEIERSFSLFSKRGSTGSNVCFSAEDECQTATNKCNSHGACTNVLGTCWQCVCSPSQDVKTGRTTKWTGYDCTKKDIAAQAHLLLWTSLALIVTLAGGVKLLFSIGNDSLPGVLEAATAKRST